jgi:hypothetical protein
VAQDDLKRHTVVASHKGIAIVPPLGTVDVLLRLLKRNVHVAIYGLELSCREEICQDSHTTYTEMRDRDSEAKVGVKRGGLTLVDNARVELDGDGVANDVAEEAGGVLALTLRDVAVLHDCRGFSLLVLGLLVVKPVARREVVDVGVLTLTNERTSCVLEMAGRCLFPAG